MPVPHGPGIGVTIDPVALKAATLTEETFKA
jgi:L-alanine-DL-glutamate epimerase-like enolase superfamily enzyme